MQFLCFMLYVFLALEIISLYVCSVDQDSMELQHKQSKAVAALCCSFPFGDFNNFVVGSEEGIVYTACRHGRSD